MIVQKEEKMMVLSPSLICIYSHDSFPSGVLCMRLVGWRCIHWLAPTSNTTCQSATSWPCLYAHARQTVCTHGKPTSKQFYEDRLVCVSQHNFPFVSLAAAAGFYNCLRPRAGTARPRITKRVFGGFRLGLSHTLVCVSCSLKASILSTCLPFL